MVRMKESLPLYYLMECESLWHPKVYQLPEEQQPQAKGMIHEIYLSVTREDADQVHDAYLQFYQAKYPKAAKCLSKDREELFAFYNFPAEHWAHLRSTNPIEPTLQQYAIAIGRAN